MFSLSGHVAIVTGGTGTLGTEFCLGLANAGAKVAVLGRREEAGKKVVDMIRKRGGEAMVLVADVLDKKSLVESKRAVIEKWGKIDILVNGAGGNQAKATVGPEDSFFDLEIDAVERVFKLNIIGTILPCQVFGQYMAEQKRGTIVNISSMAAKEPLTRVVGYSAAKSAVENFTMWLATEFAQKIGPEMRVNAIAPGFFVAEQNRKLLLKEDGTYTARGKLIVDNTPAGRYGQPSELVGALIYLCSPAASFVTGTTLRVDGGFGAFSGV